MGILSNFIGGAAQAGGDILQRQREADVDLNKQKSYADYTNDLMMKREQALATLREEQKIASEGRQVTARRNEETYQASPERIDQQVAAEGRKQKGLIQTRIELVPEAAKAGMAEFEAGSKLRELTRKEAINALTEKDAADLKFYKDNEPALLKQARDMARAKHIDDGAGLRAVQIEASKLTLDEKKKATALIEEYTTTKDPARKAELVQALTVRGIIKPGEFDTEKVTTETMNPDGTTSKVERTQKRRASDNASSSMQDVRVGGKVIGQAATPDEAAALVKKFKSDGAVSVSAGPTVPGRPLYNAKQSDLQRMANKPRGVSTAEANKAREEIEKRKGESRIREY